MSCSDSIRSTVRNGGGAMYRLISFSIVSIFLAIDAAFVLMAYALIVAIQN
jgi:hypothetical protein